MPNIRLDSLSAEEQLARLEARFWPKVNKNGPIPERRPDLGPCWLWTAATVKGYGVIGIGTVVHYAHRVSFDLNGGILNPELTLDHLCVTPRCVNPGHLEQVPMVVNTMRGDCPAAVHARKTHCPQGHGYEGSNLIRGKRGNGNYYRQCRICKNSFDRANQYKYRKRAA